MSDLDREIARRLAAAKSDPTAALRSAVAELLAAQWAATEAGKVIGNNLTCWCEKCGGGCAYCHVLSLVEAVRTPDTPPPAPETRHKPTSAATGASAGVAAEALRVVYACQHCSRCCLPDAIRAVVTGDRAGQVPVAAQESVKNGPEKGGLVTAPAPRTGWGLPLCAGPCGQTLTVDEARAGSLCEGCGGRR